MTLFPAPIIVKGERVTEIEVKQDTLISTSLIGFNNEVIPRNIVVGLLGGLADTEGQVVEDWGWHGLELWDKERKDVATADDEQSMVLDKWDTQIANQVHHYCMLSETTRYFKLTFRRADNQQLLNKVHEWGYKWNNYQAPWGLNDVPPPPQGVVVAASTHKGNGSIFGVYGLTNVVI